MARLMLGRPRVGAGASGARAGRRKLSAGGHAGARGRFAELIVDLTYVQAAAGGQEEATRFCSGATAPPWARMLAAGGGHTVLLEGGSTAAAPIDRASAPSLRCLGT